MKANIESYLKAIGMTEVLVGRVEQVLSFYRTMLAGEVEEVFVCDLIKEDGTREFVSLWVFTATRIGEAKEFVSKDSFDMTTLKGQVRLWTVNAQDYDYAKATDKSRLAIGCQVAGMIQCDLKAARENCDYLLAVFRGRILPNLMA